MKGYKFFISAYFTLDNYLEINESELKLFEYNKKCFYLKSINNKPINKSEGIKVESEIYTDINECIKIAKKVYVNFLFRLNLSHISYILDKPCMGNFCDYYKDADAELYKEICIIDCSKKSNKLYGMIGVGENGCTHFKFNELFDFSFDYNIKNSLAINNYRKYLNSKELNSIIDNTLISAEIEMLIEQEDRPKEELDVIAELSEYLNDRFNETQKNEYLVIKDMIENNKHKSIRKLKNELIKKYSPKNRLKENLEISNKISSNRTKEVHVCSGVKDDNIWPDQLLHDIQAGYLKDVKKIKHI